MDTFEPRLDILPAAQRELWPELKPVQQHGFVLYGGTAIALRLGHRQSVDFDFFNSQPVDQATLRAALPFLRLSTVRQEIGDSQFLAQGRLDTIEFRGRETFVSNSFEPPSPRHRA